jgi:uncharacterized Zn-finger protein
MCNKLRKALKSKIKIHHEVVKETVVKAQQVAEKPEHHFLHKRKKSDIFLIEKGKEEFLILDRRLKCPFANCGKKFKIRGNLNIHLRTHTKERQYKCQYPGCEKSFVTKGNLKSHSNNHTGSKTYRCHYQDCDKKYSHLCRLLIHQRTHVILKFIR